MKKKENKPQRNNNGGFFSHKNNNVVEKKNGNVETPEVLELQNTNNEEDADIKSASQELFGKTETKKMKWWERIGCRLAKKIFNENEMQIKKLEEKKNELNETINNLEENIKKLVGEITSKNEEFEKLRNSIPIKEEEAQKRGREEAVNNLFSALKQKFDVARNAMNNEEALREICRQIESLKDELKTTKSKVEGAQKSAINDAESARKQYEKDKTDFKNKLEKEKKDFEDKLQKEAQEKIDEAKKQEENAQNQMKEAERKTAEAQQRSDDADKRIAEIEATEKGELVIKLEQTENSLKDNQELVSKRDKQIEQLEEEKAKAIERINLLEKDLKKEKELHTATKKEWSEKVDGLKAEHKDNLKVKEKEHADNIKNLKDEHQTNINNIKANHDEELKMKDNAHRTEIEKEQAKAKVKEEELKDIISAHKSSIENLEFKLQAEADILRTEAEQATQHLFEFLKDNEIMVACDDDYKDKVEEKLQDVVYEAKQMCQLVKDMPKVQSPSEWIKNLTDYFVGQIDKNTSLLNRLLKYYAMSNVPFMLDAERENGIYFIRKNISQAYDLMASLLAQCGIIPIIPSAFVENKDEGMYEVAGQFNDIESFCPGNMSEHIGHIERGTDGLSGVIIGITRVGYIIKNEKIIKAQVITH